MSESSQSVAVDRRWWFWNCATTYVCACSSYQRKDQAVSKTFEWVTHSVTTNWYFVSSSVSSWKVHHRITVNGSHHLCLDLHPFFSGLRNFGAICSVFPSNKRSFCLRQCFAESNLWHPSRSCIQDWIKPQGIYKAIQRSILFFCHRTSFGSNINWDGRCTRIWAICRVLDQARMETHWSTCQCRWAPRKRTNTS